jgi:hypothetical protein
MAKQAIGCFLKKYYLSFVMRTSLLTLCFILGITATARARLGENADELTQRYGQPLTAIDRKGGGDRVALTDVIFQKGGFQINVSLADGISVAESFKKISGEILTIGEVRTLLNDNSQGYGWEAPQAIDEQKKWARDDGAVATLTGSRILTLTSKDLLVEKAVAKKLEQQPTLEGF